MEAPGKAGSSRRRAGNGLEGRETAADRGKPVAVAEPKGRTGRSEADWDPKQYARNLNPWRRRRKVQPVRTSERPLRGSVPGRTEFAACLKALIQPLEKPAVGELTGEALNGPVRDVHAVHAGGGQGWESEVGS